MLTSKQRILNRITNRTISKVVAFSDDSVVWNERPYKVDMRDIEDAMAFENEYFVKHFHDGDCSRD